MGLYERWTATDSTKITGHDWAGLMHFWLSDVEGLGNAAQQKIIDTWDPDQDTIDDFTAIKAKYDGLPNNVAKLEFLQRITHIVALVEAGAINEAQAKTALGF